MVYLAGVIGFGPDGKLVDGTIQDRTTAALNTAASRLALAGLDLSDGKLPYVLR